MLTNTGSTSLDMFKFYVEDLKEKFHKDKRSIKHIMDKLEKSVELETPYEEFFGWIKSEDTENKIDLTNLRTYFDQLVDRVASKDKDYVKQATSKKEKRNELPPMSIFQSITPSITEKSKWETSKESILNDAALSDVEESLVEQAFNDYIRVLKDRQSDDENHLSDGEMKSDPESVKSRSSSKVKKHKKEKKVKKSKKKKDKKHKKYEDISSDEEGALATRQRSRKRSGSESSDRPKAKKSKKDKR